MITTNFKVIEVQESGNTHVVEAHIEGMQPVPIHWCETVLQAESIAHALNVALSPESAQDHSSKEKGDITLLAIALVIMFGIIACMLFAQNYRAVFGVFPK